MPNLTHLDANGNITMVDIADKPTTARTATATGKVVFAPNIYTKIKQACGQTKKGSITAIAHIAGIMGAKKTHELIPLCHALALDTVKMDFDYDDVNHALVVSATAKTTHKTGVEMEALTAVSVACLTIYDMTKALSTKTPNTKTLSNDIVIGDICLVNKTGGKSDYAKYL
ncbi:molybdenum cofactor biosynthesis protein C [Moraxella macacae 0408225]|uniref:Molybdenum cofactor biosynthesis protein C n=1 Tax=Moraxella macacae 0408225 TaxID=1230338 RepID=L2F8X7_9GAMM|nr:cyclic pyranopterin monophosphate synthase MoaC [Moraxella macacae]ELA09360.1 molybdenum cofactor biosynthesis protein C [Moraxella macacae 0408225]